MSRWISGMAIATALTTRVPPRARSTLRGYRQQYAASRAIQPRLPGAERRALAGSRARPRVVSWSVLSCVIVSAATAPAAHRGHGSTEHKRFRGGRHFRTPDSARCWRGQAREGALAAPYPAAAPNTISTNRMNVITWTLVHHRQIALMENSSA